MWGESVMLADNQTFATTDGCLQPAVNQSCSGPSVGAAAGARTRLVLCSIDGCCSMGLAEACIWAARWLTDVP